MQQRGECPPLLVVFDSLEGYCLELTTLFTYWKIVYLIQSLRCCSPTLLFVCMPLELVCNTALSVLVSPTIHTNCESKTMDSIAYTHTFSFTFLVHRNDTYAYIFPVSLCRLMVILRIWPSSPNMLGMSIIWRREQTMILTVLWRSSWQLTLPKGWSFALTSGGTFLALSVASITTHSKLFILYSKVQFAIAVLSCHLKEKMCVF